MDVDFQALSGPDTYRFMIDAIVPRPIAWVLSDNGLGTYNLAPFSYFNGVASRPPTLSISIGKKRDGSKKDTWRNIEERSHFVVHIADVQLAPAVSATSASLAFGDSEIQRNDIELSVDPVWPLPRVARAKIALWCERYRIVEIGDGPQGLIIGKINRAFVKDEIVDARDDGTFRLIPGNLDPLARLGGDSYAGLGEVFEVPRPG